MHIHAFNAEISIDEVRKAHTDTAVQDQYGVKYHQFWVNKESGMVFCLAEGPDKETLVKVHQTARGNIACNILEVEPVLFKAADHGFVFNGREPAEPAYRHFMIVDIRTMGAILVDDKEHSSMLSEQKSLVIESIVRYKGRFVERVVDELLVGVFDTAVNAVQCAKVIQRDLKELSEKSCAPEFNFRMGLCSGFPLTATDEFINDALQLARRLCLGAPDKEVLVSGLANEICNIEELAPLRPLTQAEEIFLTKLFEQVENNLANGDFNVDRLSRSMGFSRPQLYRKIISLTGRSCNHFISSIRMERALALIKNKFGNISEIALEVGYCNPSYFSRCFQKSFGRTPSELIKMKPVRHQ